MDDYIINYVSQFKKDLFDNGELYKVISVDKVKEVGQVLKLKVVLETDDDVLIHSNISINKKLALGYTRGKLLKKIKNKINGTTTTVTDDNANSSKNSCT